MKKIFLIFNLLAFTLVMKAQIDFGIKAGLNTFDLHEEVFESSFNDFTLSVKEAQYGFHGGLFLRAKLGPVLLQPELVFNSDNVDYRFDREGLGSYIVNQKYRSIDVPVLAGLKIGPLRLLAGPVGHYQLTSVTDLRDQIKTQTLNEKLTLGAQLGGGFDIGKLTVDIRYEINDGKIGDNLNIDEEVIQFSQGRNRIVASLGYKF